MVDGGNGERPPSKVVGAGGGGLPPRRPTISLPPRSSMDTLFNGGSSGGAYGFSPGPMTLLSNFLADSTDDCKSFSQLLAGAMGSPVAGNANRLGFPQLEPKDAGSGEGGGAGFKQNRPFGLTVVQSPAFTVSPGLTPSGLLDSPGFFSPSQGPFGMTHQQALAQVTAQAMQAHSNTHIQAEHPLSVSVLPATSLTQVLAATSNTTQQLMPPSMEDSRAAMTEALKYSRSEQRLQSSSLSVNKPADDGYNWRKYGQKQVKGSEFPRSYYKCTHPNCPVKKTVERSLEGHVTAIIYKGEHNHQRLRPNKRAKDTVTSNENSNMQGNLDSTYQFQSGCSNKLKEGMSSHSMSKMDPESSQATAEHPSGTSDSEEVDDHETEVDEKNDEPDPKRRHTEVGISDPASSHRTVTEPRIIVQTTSEVDLLDDGYRWRKYGQKVVKGNPYPRSYYKCTTPGCNVRKHVERASTDPKAVITTYEGKHNHDVPAAKTNSHTIAANSSSQLKSQNAAPVKHGFGSGTGDNEQQPVARLWLKEEQIT